MVRHIIIIVVVIIIIIVIIVIIIIIIIIIIMDCITFTDEKICPNTESYLLSENLRTLLRVNIVASVNTAFCMQLDMMEIPVVLTCFSRYHWLFPEHQ